MSATKFRRGIWTLLFVTVIGCSNIPTSTQIVVDKMDHSKSCRPAHWDYMVDNAILHDMSLSDVDFVPHSDEINGTGAARLDRMVRLLDVYGGTVRMQSVSTDDELIARRTAHAREYLAVAGCNMSHVDFATMLPGGRGMPADQAIQAYDRVLEERTSVPASASSFTGSRGQSN